MTKLLKCVLVALAVVTLGSNTASAMHKNDPIIYAACATENAAKAVVDAYVTTLKAGESDGAFMGRLNPLTQQCNFIGEHLSDLTPADQALIKADTPASWSGPMLAGVEGAWPYISWHVEAIVVGKGTKEEETVYVVLIKKMRPEEKPLK